MSEDRTNQANEPYPEGQVDDHLLYEDPPHSAINRPASGARQASPGEILSMDFQGSETAGDFLGLDTEFTDALPLGDGELDLAAAPVSGKAAAEMSSPAEVMDPGVATDPDSYDYGYDESTEFEEDPYGEAPGEFEPEPGFYEDGFEGGFEDGFEGDEVASSGRGGRKLVLVGIGAVALLTVAGVKLAPRFLSGSGEGTEVARGPVVHHPVPTPADPVVPDVDPTPDVDPVDTTSVDADPVDTTPVPNIEEFLNLNTPDTPDTPDTAPADGDPFDVDLTQLFSGTPEDGGDPLTDMTNQVSKIFGMGPKDGTEEFPDFEQGFEWVSEDMLDMIWRGTEVPLEAISAPARTLMPRVGSVLVHMKSGEVFDGRLWAVGQNRVWIDTRPGRVGLDGAEVERIERIVSEDDTVAHTEVPGGKRVRAKVPGGWIYGKVLAENGDMVTLISDDGARVTIKEANIEPVGSHRAIIIHR